MISLTINFIDEREDPHLIIPKDLITAVLTEAYCSRMEDAGSLNIMFINDEKMAEMNEAYLNHTGPTDVLAFEDGDYEEERLILGDIAVSVDTAAKVSSENNMSYEHELTLYTLHGMLHLLGMNDKTHEERREMEDAQEIEFKKHNLVFNR